MKFNLQITGFTFVATNNAGEEVLNYSANNVRLHGDVAKFGEAITQLGDQMFNNIVVGDDGRIPEPDTDFFEERQAA